MASVEEGETVWVIDWLVVFEERAEGGYEEGESGLAQLVICRDLGRELEVAGFECGLSTATRKVRQHFQATVVQTQKSLCTLCADS